MSAFIMQQQALRQQAQSAGLLEPYPLNPEVPPATAIPSGFSAAFLAHLDNVGKDGSSESVVASSDATLDSPERPRSAQSSMLSWQTVSADDVPQAVCVVKRFRSALGVAQVGPVEARPLLQAHPKAHVTRSRSPPRLLQQREGSRLQLPSDRVDHRHRLGLGSRLGLGPFNPAPAPTLSPRSVSCPSRPSPKPGCAPAPPMPKHRAAFYAKHSRAPTRGSGASAMLASSCKSSGAPAAAGLGSPVLPQAPRVIGMQSPVSAGTGLTLQQDLHQQQFQDVWQLWSSVKPFLLPFSVVLQDLEVSAHAGELELGLLRTVSEVTALRYLRIVHKFLLQLDELWNLSWDMASQAVTVDCILSLRRDHTDCHQLNTIKALRWTAKLFRLRVEDLYEGLFRTLVAAPASGKLRRESYPLPWRLVSYLEHTLIFRTLPVPALLLAGAALTCVYGSLRWSDSQHVQWQSLMFSSSCLRALVFRTKTSRAGMPVAFRIFGVLGLGSEVRQTWLAHYLEILAGVWQEMRAAFGQAVCPDCLWFTWHKAEDAFSPLSYAQSLRFFREAAVASGLTSGMLQAQSLTLHSLKVCMLSTMLVLNIDRASRCAQGHHRGSAAELYSRDDVWSALQAQEVVLSKLQAGWLPLTPMGRGGQSPIQQLPLLPVREVKPHAVLSDVFPLLPDFSAADLGPASCSAEDEDSSVVSTAEAAATAPQLDLLQSQAKLPAQDFDSSSSDGDSVDVESLGCAEEAVFLQAKSGVCHFASPASAGTGSRHTELWLKPACGMLSPELRVLHSLPAGARLCRHKACQLLLSRCA